MSKQSGFLFGIAIFAIASSVFMVQKITDSIQQMSTDISGALVTLEPTVAQSDLPHRKAGKFTLTWYTPKELGKPESKLLTSTQKKPKKNWTIAVDPSVIPYGSIVYIQDYGYYVAEDCGGAIKGNKIDIYTDSYEEAKQHGKKVGVNVYILK